MPRTSRVIVQTAARRLEMRELPIPDVDADSALLRVAACGICGSDAAQYDGTIPAQYPVILGPGQRGLASVVAARAAGADTIIVTGYRAAIRTSEAGRIPVARMHTHDFALEDAQRAIRLLNGAIPGEQSIHSYLVPSLSRS